MADEIPNNLIPKVESVYTKENGWREFLNSVKELAMAKLQEEVDKNHYQGSVYVGENLSQYDGYKRIIKISGVNGINDFWVGKKSFTVFDTQSFNRPWFISKWSLKSDYYGLTGVVSLKRYDLNDKASCDEIVNSYVKDKPDFYIRMLDQMRSRGSSITRETKRNMMAILELAIEMGANGTTALLTAKEINPNTIPTTTGTGTTGTGTGTTGTGSAGSGSSTGANVALGVLGLVAVGLLLANSEDKPKQN